MHYNKRLPTKLDKMKKIQISVLESFSEFPGLRHCKISDDSGEQFYHQILNSKFAQAIEDDLKLVVDLDNTAGYAPSFLDEAFGNLIYDFTSSEVNKRLEIISIQEPSWLEMFSEQTFPQWEQRRIKNDPPKVTEIHDAWFRYLNKELIKKVWLKPA
jgi:hypothetical protein